MTGSSGRPDQPFWDGLAVGQLKIPRCAGCDGWTWPARFRCPECGSYEFDWPVVEPAGAIFSWTRCQYAFDEQWASRVPYTVVVAEVPSAGSARVVGVLGDQPERTVEIGWPVTGSFDQRTSGAVLRWHVV